MGMGMGDARCSNWPDVVFLAPAIARATLDDFFAACCCCAPLPPPSPPVLSMRLVLRGFAKSYCSTCMLQHKEWVHDTDISQWYGWPHFTLSERGLEFRRNTCLQPLPFPVVVHICGSCCDMNRSMIRSRDAAEEEVRSSVRSTHLR